MFNSTPDSFKNITYFIGVVEDRDDPLNLGRVRVRCFGIHNENKSKIPTAHLPWAIPVMPFHSASMSGVGISPTGAVEGSWVFGFFVDGNEYQIPMILGTMYGVNKEKIATTLGFSDPLGIYPKEKYLTQSSVNKLARGDNAYGEETLAVKHRDRTREVKTAVPPKVPTVRDNEEEVFYERKSWNEPNPRYGGQRDIENDGVQDTCILDEDTASGPNKSTYPFNHTYTTESGHVMEYDDTPGGERIHQYHTKGTFYEIQPDGTKVTKVVGDDYEILLRNKNLVIKGNLNVTIQGDARIYTQGNRIEEVDGDYYLNVKGSMVTKIQGAEQKEVMSDKATQINENVKTRVGKNVTLTIVGGEEKYVSLTSNTIIQGNVLEVFNGYHRHLVANSHTSSTGGNTNIISSSHYTVKSLNNLKLESVANVDIDAARIDLN